MIPAWSYNPRQRDSVAKVGRSLGIGLNPRTARPCYRGRRPGTQAQGIRSRTNPRCASQVIMICG
jgi:hypothetical protein